MVKKKNIVVLKIDNCLDCPCHLAHVDYNDPNADNEWATCEKDNQHRPISGYSCRNELRGKCNVPDWCPLLGK